MRPDEARGDSGYVIGTATTLVRLGGFTVLTDPNFLHLGRWSNFLTEARDRKTPAEMRVPRRGDSLPLPPAR